MQTILKMSGGKYILELDAETLAALEIDPGEAVEISGDGGLMQMRNVDVCNDESQFDAILEDIEEKYAKTFRRLAE